LIIATAGHIDHGKTVLVKALTGEDTDRLPEEKARGMSIDLGFAYVPLGDDEIIGFVDVPGHERFVRNMVAGVTGIDHALLVVAADDGPMPQTREHLAILDLLGVPGGAIALTKIDRVEPGRVTEITAAIANLVRGTFLEGVPVFPVSAPRNEGVEALNAHLAEVAAQLRVRRAAGGFRLAVDRSFVLRGAGVVVTGTVFSGQVTVDDSLTISPSGLTVRVRSIHAQNREARTGGVGERLALNISGPGVSRERVGRGDWLVSDKLHASADRLDVRLRLLPGEPSPLRHGAAVHVHLGAADVTGRIALLTNRQLAPGGAGFAQLVLDDPVACLGGDRFILRDRSAQRTIAGGVILDPQAPARGRRRPDRLAILAALENASPAAALDSLVAACASGVDLGWFAHIRNLGCSDFGALVDAANMVRVGRSGQERGFAPHRWVEFGTAVLRALAAPGPDAGPRGIGENVLCRAIDPPLSRAVMDLLLDSLAAEARIVRAGGFVRLPGMAGGLSGADARLWEFTRPLLDAGGIRPPRVRELAESLALTPEATEKFLARMAASGLVYRVAGNRFFRPGAVRLLAEIAEAVAADSDGGNFDARAFRDRSGIGRNLTIEVLEYFDAQGLTRRNGGARRIVRTAERIFGGDVGPP
jgi:selenocysteine-specific elongation factor